MVEIRMSHIAALSATVGFLVGVLAMSLAMSQKETRILERCIEQCNSQKLPKALYRSVDSDLLKWEFHLTNCPKGPRGG